MHFHQKVNASYLARSYAISAASWVDHRRRTRLGRKFRSQAGSTSSYQSWHVSYVRSYAFGELMPVTQQDRVSRF
jgi:hypothetical protein